MDQLIFFVILSFHCGKHNIRMVFIKSTLKEYEFHIDLRRIPVPMYVWLNLYIMVIKQLFTFWYPLYVFINIYLPKMVEMACILYEIYLLCFVCYQFFSSWIKSRYILQFTMHLATTNTCIPILYILYICICSVFISKMTDANRKCIYCI